MTRLVCCGKEKSLSTHHTSSVSLNRLSDALPKEVACSKCSGNGDEFCAEAILPHRLSHFSSKLFKTKKGGGSWRMEFTPGNENELLQKPALVVVSVIKRVQLLVCLMSLYVFVNLYFSSKH